MWGLSEQSQLKDPAKEHITYVRERTDGMTERQSSPAKGSPEGSNVLARSFVLFCLC